MALSFALAQRSLSGLDFGTSAKCLLGIAYILDLDANEGLELTDSFIPRLPLPGPSPPYARNPWPRGEPRTLACRVMVC